MTSSESLSETVDRTDKPFLSFLLLVSVIIGSFYVARRYLGSIPALIIAYLMYVYRKEITDEGERIVHGRT
jgi:hypothetical protein